MYDRPKLSPEELQRLHEDTEPLRILPLRVDVQRHGDAVVAPLELTIYPRHISLVIGVEFRFAGGQSLPGPLCRFRLHDDSGGAYRATSNGLAILMEPDEDETPQRSGKFRIRVSLAGPRLPPVLAEGMEDGVYRWRVQVPLQPTLDPQATALIMEMDEIEVGEFRWNSAQRKQEYFKLGTMPGPWQFAIQMPGDDGF
jgi:hypothetical protein